MKTGMVDGGRAEDGSDPCPPPHTINSNTPSTTMRENPFVLQAGSKHTCQERRGSYTGPGNVPVTHKDLDYAGGRSQLQLMLGVWLT